MLDAFEVAGRYVGRPGVDEFAVDFVGEEEQVVFFDQVADAVHLLACVQVPRGVVGIADQDTARAVVDELFEFRDVGQCESLLDRRYHGAYHGPCGDGEGHVIGVGRLGDDDLVAGVEARHEGEQHGLGTARRDDDVVGRELDLELFVVTYQFLAQRAISVAGAVFEHRTVDLFQGVEPGLRRRQVGLADVQVVDLGAACPGGFGQRDELAYG